MGCVSWSLCFIFLFTLVFNLFLFLYIFIYIFIYLIGDIAGVGISESHARHVTRVWETKERSLSFWVFS